METMRMPVAEHPFFKGFESQHLDLLAGCASSARFEAGQYIFREGDFSNAFYAIQRGKVALEVFVPGKGSITIQTLSDGDVLGWSWLVPPHKKQFDAQAIEPTQVLKLDAECLRAKCEEYPKLGYELLRRVVQILGQRLQATRLQLLDVYGAGR